MNIIPQQCKRYLPHELKTRENAVKTYRSHGDISYVCRKYRISRQSLWRWNKKYDGTQESLMDKSHRPKSSHPNAHSDGELKWIKDILRKNPSITLNEIWYKLVKNKGYKRNITSLYRVLRKLGHYQKEVIKGTSKKHNKKYNTPTKKCEKWQIDVKYVPKVCKGKDIPEDLNFYQYTCIDEASRKRYLFWYMEHTPENTVDFVNRCIKFYGFKPKEIQTDNGNEFTFNSPNIKKIHPMDTLLMQLNIKHHKIRPRTPEHNGKVERSHRNDNERFYSFLKFNSFEELLEQGKKYLKRSNNIPMKVLNYLTPNEKYKELDLAI